VLLRKYCLSGKLGPYGMVGRYGWMVEMVVVVVVVVVLVEGRNLVSAFLPP
jgi:uncharacterized membrane protein